MKLVLLADSPSEIIATAGGHGRPSGDSRVDAAVGSTLFLQAPVARESAHRPPNAVIQKIDRRMLITLAFMAEAPTGDHPKWGPSRRRPRHVQPASRAMSTRIWNRSQVPSTGRRRAGRSSLVRADWSGEP